MTTPFLFALAWTLLALFGLLALCAIAVTAKDWKADKLESHANQYDRMFLGGKRWKP